MTLYMYIASAPSSLARIIGVNYPERDINIRLDNDRRLRLYEGNTLKGTGSTVLDLDTWYRISLGFVGYYFVLYIDGNTEVQYLYPIGAFIEASFGIHDSVTADIYFDDIAVGEMGDIRVLCASPKGDGTNQDFDTAEPSGSRPWYTRVDGCPANDSDYVRHTATSDAEETYALEDRTDLGIGSDDLIKAVCTLCRMKRGGGGSTTHQIVEYDGGNYETAKTLDTDFEWHKIYRRLKPSGGSWTWAAFDAFEAGAGNAGDGGQDTYLSCVMATVAYQYVAPPPPPSEESSAFWM